MKTEIWKDIPNYEGYYQVSNYGRIRSLDRYVHHSRLEGVMCLRKGKLRSTPINNWGYKQCILHKDGVSKNVRVNKIVMETFKPDKSNFKYMSDENPSDINLDDLMVNHKDENKLNNYIENLEWCTPKYNSNYGSMPLRMREKNRHNFKPVFKCDLEGNILERFECCSDGAKSVNGRTWDIIQVADKNTGRKTAFGYVWKFDESEKS